MFKNLQIKSLLLLLVGLSGSMTAWAGEETVTFSEQKYSNGYAVESYEGDTFTLTFDKGSNSNAPKYYTSGTAIRAYGGNTVTVSSKKTISKIVITFGSSDGSNAITTDVASYSNGTWTGSATSVVFTIGGTSGNRRLSAITVTTKDETSSEVATTTTIDATGITNTDVYAGTAAGTLSATVHAGNEPISGAKVAWESSNVGVATVNANGVVTLVAAGTTTITATYAGVEGTYRASSATYELTVTNSDPNAPGTERNPYTVAQALDATPTSGTSDEVFVKGIVAGFYGSNTNILQDNSKRYYISDDGSENSTLLVYNGKGLNNVAFANADDLLVGDVVVIRGNLTTYNGTKEFAKDNYIVSLIRPVTPVVSVAQTNINIPFSGAEGTITVTYQNVEEVVADVEFCNANGESVDYDWITASVNDDNNVEYLVESNDGAARTAYMRVYALVDNNFVYSDLITITQAKFVAIEDGVIDFALFAEGYYYGAECTHGSAAKGEHTWTAGNVTFNLSGRHAYIENSKELRLYKANDNVAAGTITITAGNDKITKVEVELGDNDNITTTGFSNGTWTGYAQSVELTVSDRTDIKKITVTYGAPTITIGTAEWASYIAVDNVAFPQQGVSAYIVKGTTDTTVELEEVLAVVEGTPVVLNAEAGTYNLEVVAADECDDVANKNRLQVSDETTGNGVYVLANHNNVPGFYKWAGGLLGAGRVYLPAEAAPDGARSFLGFGNGTSTGIEAVESVETLGSMFDLQGRRVMQPTKGLYIVGGKKVVLK